MTPKKRSARQSRSDSTEPSGRPAPAAAQPVVVARVRDVEYIAPERITYGTELDGLADVSVKVRIVDGRPMYEAMTVTFAQPTRPVDVQRLPWGRLAEGAVEANARKVDRRTGGATRASGQEVHDLRKQARRASASQKARAAKRGQEPRRRAVDDERLAEVLSLRAEAPVGTPYDAFVGKRMGLSPAYVRQLVSMAKRREAAIAKEHNYDS